MEALGRLYAAAVTPARRNEDGEVDAQPGDLFGFLLVCADDERFADEYDAQWDNSVAGGQWSVAGGWREAAGVFVDRDGS